MLFERPPFHSRLALFALATSWCGTVALPDCQAGAPIDANPAPVAENLFAAAELPVLAEQVAPEAVAAGEGGEGSAPKRARRSQNVTINLINRLVARGLLPKEDADELIKQAEQDALEARAEAAEMQNATVQAVTAAASAALQSSPAMNPAPTSDTVRVTYIPEVVKAQMRDQIKDEVMAQARNENWAAPRTIPDWVPRIRLFGDVRVRYEGSYFPEGNDNTGAFPNFNAINTGQPFDVSGTVFSPQLNVDQDRQRLRLRVRLGVEADLMEGFTAGLRIATGENNSPVTTNQSLGVANQGQGGNFSKYAIWLDRGFLKYQAGALPTGEFTLSVGRFDNPFFSTEIIWDDDLGFDGIGLQARAEVLNGFTPFLNAGAFPIFNTDFNFSSNQPAKFESYDKWLYGAQLGIDWQIAKHWHAKAAAAYYYYENVEGELSDPYTPLNSSDASNTDNSRPSFAQKGNTYRAIRNIVPNALNNFGTTNQFQYFGLATPFRQIALTGRVDYTRFEPVQVSFTGEWIRNLAFDSNAIDAIAVNNRGASSATGTVGSFDGGDIAWMVGVKVGSAALEKRWDWQLSAGYRHVESDAVVDGFNDSDFGGGGTNLEGYTLGGSLALGKRVSLGLRWLSADSIAGAPYKNDILQFDINGKF